MNNDAYDKKKTFAIVQTQLRLSANAIPPNNAIPPII